jgi:molybdopterin-guanine dinucleotide biosynthesis protein A
MGGADKGLIDWRGRPLVAHVIERLAPQVDALLLSANRNLDRYRSYGYPVLADDEEGYPGPLAGLRAGLAACATDWLLTCPCDCPALPDDLAVRLLAAARAQDRPLAAASSAGRLQPTFLLCRRELLPALDAYLAAGERKAGRWCRAQGVAEAAFPDPCAFDNLNTPEELAEAAPPNSRNPGKGGAFRA